MAERLPIDDVLPEVIAALRRQSSIVLRAPTGAGKTTRVPPALLDAGLTSERIIVLEPRRLAARAAARRMAHERGQAIGGDVGYHVRFDRQVGPRTRIVVMTPGILLRALQDDPFLESVGIVLFDEFHERSLECDLALGLVRLVQTTVRPELRIGVMSATLATDTVAAYLGNAPVISSEGRLHPVDIVYEPRSLQQPWPVAAARAVERLLDRTDGDVLCFLPGMQEIRQTSRELGDIAREQDLLILPLHGDLAPDEQDRALLPQPQRRVVLATNVAETSVTVEGITGVVDTGLARMQQFDASVGMDRLEVAQIARDAADQRAGRAGRTRPGICIRLWSEASHAQRPAQTAPEISRVDLAGAVLHLRCIGERDVRRFPWLEKPREDALEHADNLLRRLGALHPDGSVTAVGRAMARLPLHPRLARMLIEGQQFRAAPLVALTAALLSERDPFQRAPDARPARRATTASDVLERVHALAAFEETGGTSFPVGTLHDGAARFLLRARDQFLRALPNESGRSDPVEPDEAIGRALLAAFPDRLARRRDNDPTKGLMVGGVGVKLAPWCGAAPGPLFLCIDVDADPRESIVRMTSPIERDWLPASLLATRIDTFFDEASESIAARKRLYFDDLIIEENDANVPRSDDVGRQLCKAAQARLGRVLPDSDSEAGAFLVRLRWLREVMPELQLPAFADAELRELVPHACAGCRAFAEVRHADWLGLLRSRLKAAQVQALEREAPERLQVPSGSRLALTYEPGRPPVLAVRIQEVFGWRDTPRLAAGRVPVLLHLLAPNQRPQQVTDDLASFWKNTYPQVRKELRIRYPKHDWPEDPLTASPRRKAKKS